MLLCVALLLVSSTVIATRDQSIAVTGRLVCGKQPAAGIRIMLIDEDIDLAILSFLDPHDVLADGYSDSNGEFRLAGATEELTAMEPVLEIYTECNDGIKSGMRKLRFGLPDQYITAGLTPEKIVDVGVINLELTYKDETRENTDDRIFEERTSVRPNIVR